MREANEKPIYSYVFNIRMNFLLETTGDRVVLTTMTQVECINKDTVTV